MLVPTTGEPVCALITRKGGRQNMGIKSNKHFRVVRNGKYFRLTHVPSGDYIQRHLCDFLMQRDAYACRDAVIAAAPEWDWSDPGLFQEMPTGVFDKVWAAIYGPLRPARRSASLLPGAPQG